MEILLKQLNEAGVRYIVIGGQAMLQEGMPRFTLDWDLFIPPRDEANFERINTVLDEELDIPLVPFDPASGEGFVQTYHNTELFSSIRSCRDFRNLILSRNVPSFMIIVAFL